MNSLYLWLSDRANRTKLAILSLAASLFAFILAAPGVASAAPSPQVYLTPVLNATTVAPFSDMVTAQIGGAVPLYIALAAILGGFSLGFLVINAFRRRRAPRV